MKNNFETYFFKVIYVLSGLTLLLYMFSLFQRPIHVDTAILGEPVYWLGKDGILRSELQRGWYHAEEHFFFTHKLFLYQMIKKSDSKSLSLATVSILGQPPRCA